jgi:hypothetical protein
MLLCAKIVSFHVMLMINVASQLLFKAETQYFTPGSLVGNMREKADRLMIVSNGSLDLYVYACDRVFHLSKTDVSLYPPSIPLQASFLISSPPRSRESRL